jgi:hypothetical protein
MTGVHDGKERGEHVGLGFGEPGFEHRDPFG